MGWGARGEGTAPGQGGAVYWVREGLRGVGGGATWPSIDCEMLTQRLLHDTSSPCVLPLPHPPCLLVIRGRRGAAGTVHRRVGVMTRGRQVWKPLPAQASHPAVWEQGQQSAAGGDSDLPPVAGQTIATRGGARRRGKWEWRHGVHGGGGIPVCTTCLGAAPPPPPFSPPSACPAPAPVPPKQIQPWGTAATPPSHPSLW